jgi:NitT/TauT family transport system permease protein
MRIPIRGQLSKRADTLIGVAGIALLVAIWSVLTYGGYLPPRFLPSPKGVWEGALRFQRQHWLLLSVWRSFLRVSKALVLVVLVGVPVGLLMGAFTPVDAFLRKVVNGAKSVPTTGILGLIVLWFGIEERGKVVFLFLGAIFFMVIMVRNAVTAVPEDFVRVALDLGANRRQMLWKVLLPGSVPRIWEAITVCNGIMWTYILLAEFLNSNQEQLGLGYLLQIGTRTFHPGEVFATLTLIAVISAFTDFVFRVFQKRFLDW